MAVWYLSSLQSTSNLIYLVSILSQSALDKSLYKILIKYTSLYLFFVIEEAERIRRSNGRVFCLHDEPGTYRVWMPNGKTPGLAVSRAFGDYCVKDFGLISVPDVSQRYITSTDHFVILATDGVYMHFLLILRSIDQFSFGT